MYSQQYVNEPDPLRNNYKPPTPRSYHEPSNQPANQSSPYQQAPTSTSYQSLPHSYNGAHSTAATTNNRNPSRASIHGGGGEPTGYTPSVIGSQEVYKDPRSRIEAKQHAHKTKGEMAEDRMSFKDKMKMFANEAGESTPVQRPKASKSQRALEESLSYGNGPYTNRTSYSNSNNDYN